MSSLKLAPKFFSNHVPLSCSLQHWFSSSEGVFVNVQRHAWLSQLGQGVLLVCGRWRPVSLYSSDVQSTGHAHNTHLHIWGPEFQGLFSAMSHTSPDYMRSLKTAKAELCKSENLNLDPQHYVKSQACSHIPAIPELVGSDKKLFMDPTGHSA